MSILRESHSRCLGLNYCMRKYLPPFLLGFLALSFQIFLLREFSVHFYGNEITFGFILASWLLWGGLGSIFGAKVKWKISRLPHMYYLVTLVFPACLIILRFSRYLLHTLPGEITGLTPMLIFSLALSFFVSFPLGMVFVINAVFLKGNVTHVYLMESLGSAVAGIFVYFFCIPILSNWQAVAITGAAVTLLIFLTVGSKKQPLYFLLIILSLAAFSFFDSPSQKLYWKPFKMIDSLDSPYGKLQVIQMHEMISLYQNSLLIYSFPNLSASEESIHFAMLQRPNAKKILLIGGGAGGGLAQVLKYPVDRVDYVELDPAIIRLSLKYLPQGERDALKDPRVQIYLQDGRAYLKNALSVYDAIILNIPDPSTAQINRFYTVEFFSLAEKKLSPGGIFSFRVTSAENYISHDLQNFLSSLYFTLKDIFPLTEIVPGDSNIFLASNARLTLDHQELSQRIDHFDLKNTYVSANSLFSRLSPSRLNSITETILGGKRSFNRDLVPISYYFNSVLWSSQFRTLESSLFRNTAQFGRFWLLDVPLICLLLIMLLFGSFRRKQTFLLFPLAVMGLTTITVEIILLIAFQTFYGYLYQKVALLFASFMTGLFLGAFRGKIRKKKGYMDLLVIQFGFVLLMFLLILWLEFHPPEIFFFLYLVFMGYLGGDLFTVSNDLYLKDKKNYGLGYGVDLIGSFLGALAVSSILIPLFGLPLLAKYLLLVNSFCFIFLIWGQRTT
jgi:spermidine synthase